LDNSKILQVLDQLRRFRLSEGEKWKAIAYEKAINSIKQYPYLIESGDQVRELPNVGKNIADKIDQILATGTVSDLPPPSLAPLPSLAFLPPTIPTAPPQTFQEKQKVLELFETIQGVGPDTSERWYEAGYRTVESLPDAMLTQEQRIGRKYRTEFLQKIPRAEIDQFHQTLENCLSPKGIFFQIRGSYRRGRAFSGDMDVALVAQPGRNIFQEVKQCGFLTDIVKEGPKKMAAVTITGGIHRKLDFELVQPHEYAFATLYFTGPGRFNELMRSHARKYGLRLNEKGLFNIQTGQSYPASTEEEIFKMLGLVYLTPQERDAYAN